MRRAIVAMIGLYALYAIVSVAVHPTFIYPFDQTPFAMDRYESRQIAPDVHVAEASGDGPAIMYFMGNAGALALFQRSLVMHSDADRHVVALEYPGGGGQAGLPSEAVIKAQALVAFDWLDGQTDAPIVLHGYSLGSSVALHVAAQRDVAGVMLDAPFARMCEQMARASALPACWLPVVQKWDSLALVADVAAPVMIQHGVDDNLAVLEDGQRLANAIEGAGGDVAFHAVTGANHLTLIDAPHYQSRIDAFVAKVTE